MHTLLAIPYCLFPIGPRYIREHIALSFPGDELGQAPPRHGGSAGQVPETEQ